MVKAQKDADSQLEVLATNETGRLAKQERAISTYVQALEQQQRALELAGQRAVLGVGQGDRQNALSGELNSQQDRFAQQSLELANQKSDPSRNMSEEEFKRKSQALADANKAATDQIRQNYADVENAQGDWTKGATAAWDNYLIRHETSPGRRKACSATPSAPWKTRSSTSPRQVSSRSQTSRSRFSLIWAALQHARRVQHC